MQILHLTDIHGDLGSLSKLTTYQTIDLIVISGDITHFGKLPEIEKIIFKLKTLSVPIFAVTGNCDYPIIKEFLENESMLIENRITELNNIQFIGLGGSLPCPGKTPNEYTDSFYGALLADLAKGIDSDNPFILITHQPPYGTINDIVATGIHVGSISIRNFIELKPPTACLTGHIHEGQGAGFIGECPVINPGPFRNGHYAMIDITGKTGPSFKLF